LNDFSLKQKENTRKDIKENKLRFCMSVIGIIISILLLGKMDIKYDNYNVYSNLSDKSIEEVKNATEIKNTYNISKEKDKIYYLVQIKGVFYTKDIENLSFKSNNIDIKTNINYKNKISTIDNISVVDLTFKLDIQPTEITFNNKNIDETNVSKNDLNKVKNITIETNELTRTIKTANNLLWGIIDIHIYLGAWCLLSVCVINAMIVFFLWDDDEE
jgi:hypothetical protein